MATHTAASIPELFDAGRLAIEALKSPTKPDRQGQADLLLKSVLDELNIRIPKQPEPEPEDEEKTDD